MSLKQFLRTLWARRWIVVIFTVAFFLAGLLAILILPRTYTAESRVLIAEPDTDPVTGQPISQLAARALIPTQIELIRDERVAGRVVDRLGWTRSPAYQELYRESGATNIEFRRWLSQQVIDSTAAKPVQNANILIISYGAGNPNVAAAMADAVRDAYVEESLAAKRTSAKEAADWLDGQTQRLRDQLLAAEARKAEFERTNGIILLDDGTDADTARLQSLSGTVDAPTTQTVGGGGNPNAAQIATLDARIATETQSLGPNHPLIQDLQRQRAALVSAGSANNAPRTVSVGPSIASQVAGARSRVLAQRGKVEEARRLWTDVKVLQDQYAKMAGEAATLRQVAESNRPPVAPIGVATIPTTPSFPRIPIVLAGSLVLGLVLGLLLALLSELLNRRVRGYDDMESLGVPLIGIISSRSVPALPA